LPPQGLRRLLKGDLDLDSGGVILVPAQPGGPTCLPLGAGNDSTLYAVRIASMGHHRTKNLSVQAIVNPRFRRFKTPAYFNGSVYISAVGDVLKRYSVASGKLVGPLESARKPFGSSDAKLSVSTDGAQNGIVWSLENSGSCDDADDAELHGYIAGDVDDEPSNSNQAGTRDQLGDPIKFAVPKFANGKVYVGTRTGLTVSGLLNESRAKESSLAGAPCSRKIRTVPTCEAPSADVQESAPVNQSPFLQCGATS
jgi:hypothetical protein